MFATEHRLLDLLKRVQNRQYDDQRGTSLTAFKQMPEFLLREPNDNENDVERMISDEEFSKKCALDHSRVEVERHRENTDVDIPGLHLSPAKCLRQRDTDENMEQVIVDKEYALDDSQVEVRRQFDTDVDTSLHLSPAKCLQHRNTEVDSEGLLRPSENRVEARRHLDADTEGLLLSPGLQQTAVEFSDEESMLPSHESAERYFSSRSNTVPSPDFNDPKLTERSLRDIGMESPPPKTEINNRTWTLVGDVADNPLMSAPAKQLEGGDDFIFAVPALPALKLYRRQRMSTPLLSTEIDERRDTEHVHHPLFVDTPPARNGSTGSSSTPSPSTHDLVLDGADCVVVSETVRVQNVAPIVDSEDSDDEEELGIV